jgi:hypothetical protein
MEHEHGAFKVNLKTFPCHPLARLKKGAKNLRFAGRIIRCTHAAAQKIYLPEI